MNLVGQNVTHMKYGSGIVIEQKGDTFTVHFQSCIKENSQDMRFSLSVKDTLRKFITFDNSELQQAMLLRSVDEMPYVEHGGKTWWRKSENEWLDIMLVPASSKQFVQELETLHQQKLRNCILVKLRELSVEELINRSKNIRAEIKERQGARRGNDADAYIKSKAFEGINYIEVALEKIINERSKPIEVKAYEIEHCLPMLSAFYRNVDMSYKCYTDIILKYRNFPADVFSGELYTSLSAAFCDLGDLDSACDYFDLAIKSGQNRNSVHLENVYNRIQAMLSERGDV